MEERGAFAPALADVVEQDVDRAEHADRMRVKVGEGSDLGAVTDRREDSLCGVTGEDVAEILAIDQGYARPLGEEAFRSSRADAVRRAGDRDRLPTKRCRAPGTADLNGTFAHRRLRSQCR